MAPKIRRADFIWRVMGFFNRNIANRNFRLGIMPDFILMLTTTGRKSGQPRRTLLQYESFEGGFGVASVRGASADWYRNILADPNVTIQFKKQPPQEALAEVVSDPARMADFILHRQSVHPRMISRMLSAEGLKPPYTRDKVKAFSAGKAMVILRPKAVGDTDPIQTV